MPTHGTLPRRRLDMKRIRALERKLIANGVAPHNAREKAQRKARRRRWFI